MSNRNYYVAVIAGLIWTGMTLFAGLKWGETKGLREIDSTVITELRQNYKTSLGFIEWTAKIDSSRTIAKKAQQLGFLR